MRPSQRSCRRRPSLYRGRRRSGEQRLLSRRRRQPRRESAASSARPADGRRRRRTAAPWRAAGAGARGRRRAAAAPAAPPAAGRPTSRPRPGTRSSSSFGARFRSTGKRSRCASAQASLGSTSSDSMPRVGRHDLVVAEAVEAHQPVGLVEPVLAHQRRRLQRQGARRIGDRAEGRVVDALQPVRAVERGAGGEDGRGRWWRRRRRSSACSAPPARSAAARRVAAAASAGPRAGCGRRASFASSIETRSRAIERRIAAPSFSGASAASACAVGSSMLMLRRSA